MPIEKKSPFEFEQNTQLETYQAAVEQLFLQFAQEYESDPSILNSIQDKLDDIFDSLPDDIRSQLGSQKDIISSQIQILIQDFFQSGNFSFKDVQQIKNLATRAIATILFHTDHTAIQADHENLRNDPQVADDRINSKGKVWMSGRKGLAIAVGVASAYTTYLTGQNRGGAALEAFSGDLVDPAVVVWSRNIIAGLLAGGFSWKIYDIKNKVTEGMDKFGDTVVGGMKRTYQKYPIQSMVSILILAGSIYSNVVGGFMAFGQKPERKKQIDAALAQVGSKALELERAFDDMVRKISPQIKNQVGEILKKEEQGDAASGMQGKGPAYHSKNYALTEDPASKRYIDDSTSPSVTAQKSTLRRHTEIVGDGFSLEAEALVIADIYKGEMQNIFHDIEAMKNTISTGEEPEVINAKLKTIVEKLKQVAGSGAIEGLFQKAKDELGEHAGLYNQLLLDINRTANSSNVTNLDELSFDIADVKIEDIQIPNVEFKGVGKIIEFIWKEFKSPLAALFVLMAIGILCGTFDVLDGLLLGKLQKHIQEDRLQGRRRRKEYLDKAKDQIVDHVFERVNTSSLAQMFTHEPVPRQVIAQSLEDTLDELNIDKQQSKGKDNPAVVQVGRRKKIVGWLKKQASLQTTPSHEYNVEREALLAFVSDPDHIQRLYEKFCPGVASFMRNKHLLPDAIDRMLKSNKNKMPDLIKRTNKQLDTALAEKEDQLNTLEKTKAKIEKKQKGGKRKSAKRESTLRRLGEEITQVSEEITELKEKRVDFSDYTIGAIPEKVYVDNFDLQLDIKQLRDSAIEDVSIAVKNVEPGDYSSRDIDPTHIEITSDDTEVRETISLSPGENEVCVRLTDKFGRVATNTYTIDYQTADIQKRRIQNILNEIKKPVIESYFQVIWKINDFLMKAKYEKSPVNLDTAQPLAQVLEDLQQRVTPEICTSIEALRTRNRFFENDEQQGVNTIYSDILEGISKKERALQDILEAVEEMKDKDTSQQNWNALWRKYVQIVDTDPFNSVLTGIANEYPQVNAPEISFFRLDDQPVFNIQNTFPDGVKWVRDHLRLKMSLQNITQMNISVTSEEPADVIAEMGDCFPMNFEDNHFVNIENPLEVSTPKLRDPLRFAPGLNKITFSYEDVWGRTHTEQRTIDYCNDDVERARTTIATREARENREKEEHKKRMEQQEIQEKISGLLDQSADFVNNIFSFATGFNALLQSIPSQNENLNPDITAMLLEDFIGSNEHLPEKLKTIKENHLYHAPLEAEFFAPLTRALEQLSKFFHTTENRIQTIRDGMSHTDVSQRADAWRQIISKNSQIPDVDMSILFTIADQYNVKRPHLPQYEEVKT